MTLGFGTFVRGGGAPRLGFRSGDVVVDLGEGSLDAPAVAGPSRVGEGDRGSSREARRRGDHCVAADECEPLLPVHRRRLRRLLLLARARDEPRAHVPAGRGAVAPELAAPARRLPRPGGDGRRQRHAGPAAAGAGEAAGCRGARLRPVAAARHRARARVRRRVPEPPRGARPHERLPRARLRRRARQRLERARHPGVGVRPARPVPRQELRHVDLRVGDAARAARGPPRARATAGAGAAAVPSRRRGLGARPPARGRAERHRDLARQRARPLLDDAAAARARDLERREHPDGRPDGLGHDLRRRARQRGQPDRADLERERAAAPRRRQRANVPRGRRRGRAPRRAARRGARPHPAAEQTPRFTGRFATRSSRASCCCAPIGRGGYRVWSPRDVVDRGRRHVGACLRAPARHAAVAPAPAPASARTRPSWSSSCSTTGWGRRRTGAGPRATTSTGSD